MILVKDQLLTIHMTVVSYMFHVKQHKKTTSTEVVFFNLEININYLFFKASLANSKSPKVAEPLSATAGRTISSSTSGVAT